MKPGAVGWGFGFPARASAGEGGGEREGVFPLSCQQACLHGVPLVARLGFSLSRDGSLAGVEFGEWMGVLGLGAAGAVRKVAQHLQVTPPAGFLRLTKGCEQELIMARDRLERGRGGGSGAEGKYRSLPCFPFISRHGLRRGGGFMSDKQRGLGWGVKKKGTPERNNRWKQKDEVRGG